MVIPNNNEISYYLYETTEIDSMLGQYLTYGIRVNMGEEICALYRDISTDKGRMASLINTLNKECVPPYQLEEILEDFLP